MLQSDEADEVSDARRLGGPEAEAMLFYVFLEPRPSASLSSMLSAPAQ